MALYKQLAVGLIALSCMITADLIQAEEIRYYRYKDSKGTIHLETSITDQALRYGYQVIDSQGRVKSTVSPALTPEEREKRRHLRELAIRYQKEDASILRNFRTAESYAREQSRQLERLEQDQARYQKQITNTQQLIDEIELEAAEMERSGKEISGNLENRRDFLISKKKSDQSHLEFTAEKKERTQLEYERKLKRYQEAVERQAIFAPKK